MNYKSLFFLVVFSLTLISGVFAQKKVSILGDSYSTFTVMSLLPPISAGMEFPAKRKRMM